MAARSRRSLPSLFCGYWSVPAGARMPFDSLVARVRGEYGEMPGLRLTVPQACHLWHIDVSTCEMVFEQLVREGSLYKTDKIAYIAQPTTRKRI